MAFNTNLRRLMDARGMNNVQLAPLVGVTPQAVSQWLVGKTTPVGSRLQRIAQALGVKPAELLAEPTGMADAGAAFAGQAPPRLTGDELARIGEAVASLLRAEGLPTDPGTLVRVTRAVERDVLGLSSLLPFADRLDLTLSEHTSRLKRNWNRALDDC